MIPLERFAADTAMLGTLAGELELLAQTYRASVTDFDQLAALVRDEHKRDRSALQEVARLRDLNDALSTIERGALALIDRVRVQLEASSRQLVVRRRGSDAREP